MSQMDRMALNKEMADDMAQNMDNGKSSKGEGLEKERVDEVEKRRAEREKTAEKELPEKGATAENAERGEREQRKETATDGPSYSKELTMSVELLGEDKVTMMELLRTIKDICGLVVGCRYIGINKYEITMNHHNGKRRLMDGFKIRNTRIMAKELTNDEMVVSFIGLPVYITDGEILRKLSDWGVNAISPIKRRMWPGTRIVEGTRFVKVKFTDTVRSLPYSTRFETEKGAEFFRVIHDRQVKVCRLCIQPGHIVRECPDFLCRKCGEQGHYARECVFTEPKCTECGNRTPNCVCEGRKGEEEGSGILIDMDEERGTENGEGEEEEEDEEEGMSEGEEMMEEEIPGQTFKQIGERVGGDTEPCPDVDLAALKDPTTGCSKAGRSTEESVRVTRGRGVQKEPLLLRAMSPEVRRSAAIESVLTTDSASGWQGVVSVAPPPSENGKNAGGNGKETDSVESEGELLLMVGGRKRALLERPSRLAVSKTQNERKKGKLKE